MIREAIRATFISACITIVLGAAGIWAINQYTEDSGNAEYLVTWTGDAPPTTILYLDHGAVYRVTSEQLAGDDHRWFHILAHTPGDTQLHIEVTQPLPYHGVTTASISINGKTVTSGDTKFGRKSIILSA